MNSCFDVKNLLAFVVDRKNWFRLTTKAVFDIRRMYTSVSIVSFLAVTVPILIPIFQFGVIFRLWDRYNQPVNKDLCICSCWDTVFKGKICLVFHIDIFDNVYYINMKKRCQMTNVHKCILFQVVTKQVMLSTSTSISTVIEIRQ